MACRTNEPRQSVYRCDAHGSFASHQRKRIARHDDRHDENFWSRFVCRQACLCFSRISRNYLVCSSALFRLGPSKKHSLYLVGRLIRRPCGNHYSRRRELPVFWVIVTEEEPTRRNFPPLNLFSKTLDQRLHWLI